MATDPREARDAKLFAHIRPSVKDRLRAHAKERGLPDSYVVDEILDRELPALHTPSQGGTSDDPDRRR